MPLVEALRNDETRLRIYALLAEHNSQAKVIEITGIDKGQVSMICERPSKRRIPRPCQGNE